jgi:flavodoxin
MKTLVVYYSYTGHNRKVADEIRKFNQSDIFEIKDWLQKLPFPILLFVGGMMAARRIPSRINRIEADPEVYDRIIIVGPVWAGKLIPAIRAFLTKYRQVSQKIILVCVCGGGEKFANSVNQEFQKLTGIKLSGLFIVSDAEFAKNNYQDELQKFIK